jgi:hypothetical protein
LQTLDFFPTMPKRFTEEEAKAARLEKRQKNDLPHELVGFPEGYQNQHSPVDRYCRRHQRNQQTSYRKYRASKYGIDCCARAAAIAKNSTYIPSPEAVQKRQATKQETKDKLPEEERPVPRPLTPSRKARRNQDRQRRRRVRVVRQAFGFKDRLYQEPRRPDQKNTHARHHLENDALDFDTNRGRRRWRTEDISPRYFDPRQCVLLRTEDHQAYHTWLTKKKRPSKESFVAWLYELQNTQKRTAEQVTQALARRKRWTEEGRAENGLPYPWNPGDLVSPFVKRNRGKTTPSSPNEPLNPSRGLRVRIPLQPEKKRVSTKEREECPSG